jgi:DNA-binding MarR family transcriptional regulator
MMPMDQVPTTRLLLEAYRALGSEIQRGLADRAIFDLRPSHAATLLLIDRAGSRLTDLSTRAGVTRQAMMQVIDGLVRSGSVRRVPDATDGRAKVVRLTARGLRERAEARRTLGAVEARIRRRLGDRRYEALRGLLEELARDEE